MELFYSDVLCSKKAYYLWSKNEEIILVLGHTYASYRILCILKYAV